MNVTVATSDETTEDSPLKVAYIQLLNTLLSECVKRPNVCHL